MSCQNCGSARSQLFNGEVALHFPGQDGLTKPLVCVFPKLLVCLDCGFTEFTVPESETRVLREGIDTSTAA